MTINRITYLSDYIKYDICIINEANLTILHFGDLLDWKIFLSDLIEDQIYVVSLELVPNFDILDEDGPNIILSKPILITKNSNPKVISDFIFSKIHDACNSYGLQDNIINRDIKSTELPGVIIKYKAINYLPPFY